MGEKTKIGNDVLGHRTFKRKNKKLKKYTLKNLFSRFLSDIEKVKTVESLNIVWGSVKNAYSNGKLNDAEFQALCSELSKKASEVGEKDRTIKLGPLGEWGIEKKGKF